MHAALLVQAAAEGVEGCSAPVYLCKTEYFEFVINLIRSANPFLGSGRDLGGGLPGGNKNKNQADVEGIQARLNRDETCSAIVI